MLSGSEAAVYPPFASSSRGPLPQRSTALITVQAYSLYGPRAASHRVRLLQFQSGLAARGIELQIHSLLDAGYVPQERHGMGISKRALLAAFAQRLSHLRQTRSDLAIVYAELLPLLPAWLEQRSLKIPTILDLDDAFHLKYRSGRLGLLQPLFGSKIDRLMAGAAAITAGNQHLANYARRFNPRVTLLPSVVDTEHYQARATVTREAHSPAQCTTAVEGNSAEPGAPFTVGWIGSPSTAPYLRALVEPLQQLARERPVRLLVVGGSAPSIAGVQVIEQPWSLADEVQQIHRFDVGVMPLPDTAWTRGKCAFKLIQCLACGVPVVASPVGANLEVVTPACGLLAGSASEWLAAFRKLAAKPLLRAQLGAAGRRWVEERYSLRSALPVMEGVIRQVAQQGELGRNRFASPV